MNLNKLKKRIKTDNAMNICHLYFHVPSSNGKIYQKSMEIKLHN